VSQIHLVMMTYNRLEYTKLSLPQLLRDTTEDFSLTLWDNGSTDGTREYIDAIDDRRIVEKVFSETNKGQAYVTNLVWQNTNADLVGKVDNDCLVTPGWTRILTKAHEDIPQLGVVGCWHFFPEDFDYERAKHKIQSFNGHQIFRHPSIDGSALLMKRSLVEQLGPCGDNEYLSGYWRRLALAGYINGFYYPLVYQEHMDDPLSEHCLIRDDADLARQREVTYSLRYHRQFAMADIWFLRQEILRNLFDDPFDVKYYVGWRGRFRRWRWRLRRLKQKLWPGRVPVPKAFLDRTSPPTAGQEGSSQNRSGRPL